jgi:hypothetical protein
MIPIGCAGKGPIALGGAANHAQGGGGLVEGKLNIEAELNQLGSPGVDQYGLA